MQEMHEIDGQGRTSAGPKCDANLLIWRVKTKLTLKRPAITFSRSWVPK
jgi:hypothetical protein